MKLRKVITMMILVVFSCLILQEKVSAVESYTDVTIDNFYLPPVDIMLPFEYGTPKYGGNYVVHWMDWYVENQSHEWQKMDSGNIFESEKNYKLCITLNATASTADEEYFAEDAQIYINDQLAERDLGKNMRQYERLARIGGCIEFVPVERILSEKPNVKFVATGYKTGHFEGGHMDDTHQTEYMNELGQWRSFSAGYFEPQGAKNGGTGTFEFRSFANDLYYKTSEILLISIDRANAPENIKIINGSIVNVDETMEWTNDISAGVDDDTTMWNDVVENKISPLCAGKYFIRKKAAGSTYASDYVEIEVSEEDTIIKNDDIINPNTGNKSDISFLLVLLSILGLIIIRKISKLMLEFNNL